VPIRLATTDADFAARFAALLAAKREVSEEVDAAAAEIIEAVRRDGDAALVRLSQRFDDIDLASAGIAVGARDRIEAYHRRQMPKD